VSLFHNEKIKCTFDGEDSNSFIESITAQNILFAKSPAVRWGKWNEYIVPAWDMTKPKSLPIDSIWYGSWEGDFTHPNVGNFLEDAQHYQT
jgi:hypothetical protein